MKRVCALIMIIFFFPSLEGANSHYFITLKKHSSDGYYLLQRALRESFTFGEMKVEVTPATHYIRKGSPTETLMSLPIAVHEASHHFSDIRALEYSYKNSGNNFPETSFMYYQGKGSGLYTAVTKGFDFKEIKNSVDMDLPANRFQVHASKPFDEQLGVYELLDESYAYFWQSQTALDLIPAYAELAMEGYKDSFKSYIDGYVGIIEYYFYMIVYLDYANRNYPVLYETMKNNKPLQKSAVALKDKSIKHYNRYFKLKRQIAELLAKEKVALTETGNQLVFTYPDQTSQHVETQSKIYKKYKILIDSKRFKKVIKDFGLRGPFPEYETLK
jgi:hypothetical protein